jgi:predicted nucleic acid-binding protein
MKEEKTFLDTNVIVYGYDTSAGRKHEIAREILTVLWNSGLGVISTQVLQEFFVTVTRKIPKRLGLSVARRILVDFLKWEVILIDGNLLLDAVDLQDKHKFSFWDSMVLCSAIRSGAKTLYSEDLQDGALIGGMAVTNPFGASGSLHGHP